MAKFEFEGIVREVIEEEIEASNMKEAYQIFKKKHPKAKVEWIGDSLFIGFCEYSGEIITDEDDYFTDSEADMYWLKKYAHLIKE